MFEGYLKTISYLLQVVVVGVGPGETEVVIIVITRFELGDMDFD